MPESRSTHDQDWDAMSAYLDEHAKAADAPEPQARRHAVTFVMPAFNEEANILAAIERTSVVAHRLCADHEIIVVDDGSHDRTSEFVAEATKTYPEVRLIRHGRNRGYGEALRTGFLSATRDLVFFTDSDNQFDMEELSLLLPWIDHVDVVAGFRANRQDPFLRRLNARAWNLLVRVLFYVPVRDIDCAFKLFRRSALRELDIEAVGAMVNTELMVKIGRAGKAVVEVPVTHLPRTAGKARGANPRVIVRAFLELARMYHRLDGEGVGRRLVPVPPPLGE